MKNINKKSINMGLKMLAVLAFAVLLIPASASAYGDYYGQNTTWGTIDNSYLNSYNNNGNNTVYSAPYQAPVYVPPPTPATTTPVVYSSTTNPNPEPVASAPAPKKTVAKAKTPSPTVAYYIAVPAGATVVNTLPAGAVVADANTTPANFNNLTANAVYGSNGFLPSGIIQWILLAIFILLLVILSRIIFGARDNYHSTPLKHD